MAEKPLDDGHEANVNNPEEMKNAFGGEGPGAGMGTTVEGQKDEHTNPHITHSPSTESKPANGSTSTSTINEETPASPTTPVESTNPEDLRTPLQTTIIMLSLCSSVFLAALDTTIITTALPTISEYFHSNAGYTWIGSAYLLANAASVPSWGKFSDIWGRKPVLLVACAVFFIGSLLAAVSVTIGMLITARAIQGIGGGGLIILVNICISDLFSMRNRGKYFGIVGMVWALACAVGPIRKALFILFHNVPGANALLMHIFGCLLTSWDVVGGIFTEKVSWRWCFYINLPITGIVFFALVFFLHLHNPKTPVVQGLKAVDWLGSLTIVGGTLMLLLGLEFGGVTYPWKSVTVICLIVFGIVAAGLFVINEWKVARYPVMPLQIFKFRSNLASLGVCFCHGFVFIAGTYYLPLYFQAVLGATPILSGVYLLPFALTLSIASGLTGVFIKKTGKYLPPIWFGLVVMVLGFGLFIDLPLHPGWAKIIIYQIIAGIGVGPNFQSPLLALQTMVAPRDIATATATFGFTRNLSTAISVVIGGVVFQNEMNKRSAALIAALGPTIAFSLSGGSAGASVGIVSALPAGQREVAREAFWESLRIMWIVYTVFAALGLACSLLIAQNVLSEKHEEVKTGLAEQEKQRKEDKEAKRVSRGERRSKNNTESDQDAERGVVDDGVVAKEEA